MSGALYLNGGVDVDNEGRPGLVPLLRSGDYSALQGEFVRPLVQAHGDKQWLWVTLAFDHEHSLEPALARQVGDVEVALSLAVHRARDRMGEWHEERDDSGGLRALIGMGELASERLLCAEVLRTAAARLGCDAVAVAVPVRGLIRVQQAFPREPAPITSLLRWSELVYDDAVEQPTMTPLTSVVFVVTDGVISGQVRGVSVEDGDRDEQPEPLRAGDVRAVRLKQAVWWRRAFRKKR